MSSTMEGSSSRGLIRTYSRSNSNSGSSENLPPRALSRVAREVRDVLVKPPEGVRLVVDSETGVPANLGEITAEIEGPTDTPYQNRYFQLKLVLASDFPASPPRGFFLTKIYHPNVDMSTGAICVNTLKKDWTSATTFSHVLSVIRCLLIVPFPESSLNDEAGKLFMESYEEFARRARLMADVHGRPRPFSDKGYERDSGKKIDESTGNLLKGDTSLRGKMTRGLSTSSLPQHSNQISTAGGARRSGTTLTRSTSVGSATTTTLRVTGNKNVPADKKSKKKGLKRL